MAEMTLEQARHTPTPLHATLRAALLLGAAWGAWALGGCTSVGGVEAGGTTTGAQPIVYEGTYASEGTWDLSGPFAHGRTLGDVVVDVVIQQAIAHSNIPGPLKDDAEEALAGVLHDRASDLVDRQLPDDLGPDGDVIARLGEVFATVDVTTELTLEGGRATERLLALHVHHRGERVAIPLQALTRDGDDPLMVAADIDVRAQERGLELEPHTFEIHLGRLVQWLVEDVLIVDTAPVREGIDRALDCDALVSRLTQGALTLEVAGRTFDLEPRLLASGCEAARGQLTETVIGLTHKDTGVELGGAVLVDDSDGDGLADLITSAPGYGGALTSVPGPLDPSVSASFTATRVR